MQVTLKWRASWLVMTGLEKKTDGFSNDFNRKKKKKYHVFSESGDRFFSSSIVDLSTTDLGYSWLMTSLVIKKLTKTREYQNPWGIQSSEDTWFCTASINMGW